MEQILASIGTILSIILVYIANEFRSGRNPFKKTEDVPKWAKDLQLHFNHETTEYLKNISEGVTKLNAKHEEWEKYGIPTRECKALEEVKK